MAVLLYSLVSYLQYIVVTQISNASVPVGQHLNSWELSQADNKLHVCHAITICIYFKSMYSSKNAFLTESRGLLIYPSNYKPWHTFQAYPCPSPLVPDSPSKLGQDSVWVPPPLMHDCIATFHRCTRWGDAPLFEHDGRLVHHQHDKYRLRVLLITAVIGATQSDNRSLSGRLPQSASGPCLLCSVTSRPSAQHDASLHEGLASSFNPNRVLLGSADLPSYISTCPPASPSLQGTSSLDDKA